ncbi:hypothetical protein BXZ70DRAFT_962911 [Cristinia sonorae]|uniref:Phytochrome n=1 Tax=Cristinia sonorae TaxID=1940300 RepID=A0A8K0XJT0_9AGAR|nr:hypothetical protein BXZ70DRAFT_962911 [Cristinia sonorae]
MSSKETHDTNEITGENNADGPTSPPMVPSSSSGKLLSPSGSSGRASPILTQLESIGGADAGLGERHKESGLDDSPVSSSDNVVHKRMPPSPNFRDFSTDEDPLAPRVFSLRTLSPSIEFPPNQILASGPTGEPVVYDEAGLDSISPSSDYNPRRPSQVSEVAAEAFAHTIDATIALVPSPMLEEDSVPNFSQSGIVHLGPIPSDNSSPAFRTRSIGSSSRSRGAHDGMEHVWPGDSRSFVLDSRPRSPVSALESNSFQSSGQASSTNQPHVTFRYQHIEDESGHHLIVGREGTLTKCEDEPIRTPGAVQGFGVLIAVEEDYETGNLNVRQVSENSTELLGLSPQYLFSLDCFSQILSQQEADQLFDNVSYLSDAALTSEEQAENLHVFMLNGYGEPGTALPEERSNDPQQRRSWTCWCAAHRPEPSPSIDPNSSTAKESNLIILEFELERDTFNPLYPPPVPDNNSSPLSGLSSRSEGSGVRSDDSGVTSDGSGSGIASDSSGRTLVSNHTDDSRVSETSGSDGDLPNSSSATANSLVTTSRSSTSNSSVDGEAEWVPSPEDILESTTSRARPLLALERLRRNRRLAESVASYGSGSQTDPGTAVRGGTRPARGGAGRNRRGGGGGVGMMDVFAVMAQMNEQLGAAPDLETFLKVVAGVVKDLTQFHRVLVYQFDELWNGKVVAELVDWDQTHDLFHGLHFPATDIPAQARHLYALNKVRLLYDRSLPTARLVVRSKKDLDPPLNMTHCYLRAMSPIHIKYLGNMGVRASMSVSIMASGQLWGLVACHSYGPHGMRVSFPVRQMLRLLSQSISRNVERLSYAQRLHTRKLINTMPTDQHPSGYIVSNADDLLGLFDADFGVLVIGEGAKILGPNVHSQEILIVAEYLRLKQFESMQVSQAITTDYPDLHLSTGLEVVAGLLYVPLSSGGKDFIAFLRKGQPREVKWAGRPYRQGQAKATLEPRTSFKLWSETVAGRSRIWSEEQLETAGVLALVYGKFIEVWRQKETALQATKLTNILLSNASHEVRTPLNHIINYLELALNGQLDGETRENLSQSHAASKSLLFTINDLLDLTRLESGNETSFNEPFNLRQAVEDAVHLYRNESSRRGLEFEVDMVNCPKFVIGDAKKIRTLVANLTANAVKYTQAGKVRVECRAYDEPEGLRSSGDVAVEIVVADTGCGIPADKLESIFREFEQVELEQSAKVQAANQGQGLGLGLAVVARIVEQLGGQLRVDSKVGEGSRFSFLVPFATRSDGTTSTSSTSQHSQSAAMSRTGSRNATGEQIGNLVQALSHIHGSPRRQQLASQDSKSTEFLDIEHSSATRSPTRSLLGPPSDPVRTMVDAPKGGHEGPSLNDMPTQLRILIVEDNDINRTILAKRLSMDGHTIVNTTNGQEGLEMVESDRDFDCVLMDIQMPLLNGYESTERIRALEEKVPNPKPRPSHILNGRLPIFAVSASLFEEQREDMHSLGMDGWILKPIDFKRLRLILKGVTDPTQREKDVYRVGRSWEAGGWLTRPKIHG